MDYISTFVFYYFSYPGGTQKMNVDEQRASDKIVGNSSTSNTVEGIVCSKALSSFARRASVIAALLPVHMLDDAVFINVFKIEIATFQ